MAKHFTENARARFIEIVSRNEEGVNLAEAALLIAAEEYPRLDIARYLEKLENFGARARERAANLTTAPELITALNVTLFTELGFQGNRENYYDPRNSFLNEVIDRRTGIPITLSVVYIEVARQIGFTVEGVGLPGHFVAGHFTPSTEYFIDVFNDGRLLSENACADLVAGMSQGKVKFESAHLDPVTKKQILTRMLSNLLAIYSASQDYRRAVAAIERILLIMPNSLSHIREYGLLLAQAGSTNQAIEQLERYLTVHREAENDEVVTAALVKLKQAKARLN
jgi:regulator of sirC expression with transglutaminase-like and TPR domain